MPLFPQSGTADVIAAAAVFATVGWIYTARRARTLARKQHTINIIVAQAFNKQMRNAQIALANALRGKAELPPPGPEQDKLLPDLRMFSIITNL